MTGPDPLKPEVSAVHFSVSLGGWSESSPAIEANVVHQSLLTKSPFHGDCLLGRVGCGVGENVKKPKT